MICLAKNVSWGFLVLGLLLASGCSDNGVLGTAMGNTGAGQGPPATPVAVVPARTGEIAKHYFATATLEPNKEADVVARVSGVVLALAVEEGDRVETGDSLLSIEEDAYLLRLNQARAEETKQQTRYSRQEKMFSRDLISAEEFDATRTDVQAAEAASALASLELSHARVKAPFAGHVVRRSVDAGQMVNSGSTLFRLADMSRLLARVHVPAKEFRSIQVGQPVTLNLDSNQAALDGEIILVSPVIDATSGTIKVTVAVSRYPEGTRPGDFAEVCIETDRHLEVVLVPGQAVFSDRGEDVVYLASEGKALRRAVSIGFQDDHHMEIVEGVTAGDQVVVQGQRSLREGQAVKILDRVDFTPASGEEAPAVTAAESN